MQQQKFHGEHQTCQVPCQQAPALCSTAILSLQQKHLVQPQPMEQVAAGQDRHPALQWNCYRRCAPKILHPGRSSLMQWSTTVSQLRHRGLKAKQ
jgi:hypothetical protein